jgi:2-polyprenyl-3-methyl-5-hydroxy-6-metoxy-1,4-benzoquinol methylase
MTSGPVRGVLPCPVDSRHRGGQKAFERAGVGIHLCADCGCIMADVDFVHVQYEAQSYYTMMHPSLAGIEGEWGFRWRHILRTMLRLGAGGKTLLDVGAGNGYFVSLARGEFGLEAQGLEISSREVAFARDVVGVQLLQEDLATHAPRYDFVASFNVVEHVVDPRGFFAALVQRVVPGGLVLLTTPSPQCIHVKLRGLRKWGMIAPPHHINLMTRASLDALVQAEGLELLHYETLSTYVNFVRKFDTESLLLRRLVFQALRLAGWGADHFMVLRRPTH